MSKNDAKHKKDLKLQTDRTQHISTSRGHAHSL